MHWSHSKTDGDQIENIKSRNQKLVLFDEKGLGGKNRLSKAVIDQIQNYYGLAIRRTTDSEEKMRNNVWALFYHKRSTDENPHHELCPKASSKLLPINCPIVIKIVCLFISWISSSQFLRAFQTEAC